MIDLEDFCSQNPSSIHNFSYGTINSYYQPLEMEVNDNSFSILCRYGKNRRKKFSYVKDPAFRNEDICYSPFPIGLKRTEIAHDLEKLFDPSSYERKKRYNTIIYPFNWASKNNLVITPLKQDNLAEVEALHEKWVGLKLSDEKTFQIMFPRKRYLKCFLDSLENPNYRSYGAFLDGQLVSVRVIYVLGNFSFDLAFFTDYHLKSQLTNFVDVLILRELKESGIRFLNRGVELNKGLKNYKTQFPHFEVYFYEAKNPTILEHLSLF